LRIRPAFAEAHNNLGVVLRTGEDRRGIGHFLEAVRIRPGYAEGDPNLLDALARRGTVRRP
jgi:hypothetical protein